MDERRKRVMIVRASRLAHKVESMTLFALLKSILLLLTPAVVAASTGVHHSTAFVPRHRYAASNNGEQPDFHEPPRIIVIGGPASGKGTQCEILTSTYGVVHLSTGDLLRQAVKDGTDVGLMAKAFMESGDLVPDDVMIRIITDRLNQRDCQEQGWILDGFPRTQAQADALIHMGIQADICLVLDVSDEVMTERITGRRLDPVTGKVYHLKFRPPPPSILDRLEQRGDDTLETIVQRIRQYRTNLGAIRTKLQHKMVEIDASGSPNSIAESIRHEIDATLRKKRIKT